MVYVQSVMKPGKDIVNSHNEWDTLEEVIVGKGLPEKIPALDFTFRLHFHDNIYNVTSTCGSKLVNDKNTQELHINKRHIHEHNEDIENYVDLLKSHGITVRRPKTPDKINTIKTPDWESSNHPALNVRDLTMIVGNKIIETPPSLRFRYFENDFLKHLFLEYFKSGAEWITAPRPLMVDESFDLSYYEKDNGAIAEYRSLVKESKMSCGQEIMFDAANCMRLGEHILFNSSTKNSDLGLQWLQRTLGDRYKILKTNVTDTNIDSTFLPLRPGLALMLKPDKKHLLPKCIQTWDLIDIPLRDRSAEDINDQGIKLASPRIELNVLSIDKSTIICHPEYRDILHEKLRKYKFNVIPCRMRHCELFSGAHHCLTLYVRRNGKLENYF